MLNWDLKYLRFFITKTQYIFQDILNLSFCDKGKLKLKMLIFQIQFSDEENRSEVPEF